MKREKTAAEWAAEAERYFRIAAWCFGVAAAAQLFVLAIKLFA